MRTNISISPGKLSGILFVVVVLLTLASSAGSMLTHLSIDDYYLAEMRESFIRLFNLDGEANISAWYSSSALLLCSFLLGIIALAKKMNHGRYVFHWGFLSVVFLYLSVDEAAMLHEMTLKPLQSLLHLGGFLYYAWIIPAGVAVLILGLTYVRFLAHLAPKTRWLFVIAGLIYVGAAIGVESINGRYVELYNQGIASDGMITIIVTVEEFLEMVGVVVFVYALLDYMQSSDARVRFYVGDQLTP
jgi:hypothetical protein